MLPYINTPFEYVGSLIGSSADELKLIFSFLLSFPLAGLLSKFPDDKPNTKNIFIISIGLFYLVGLFDLWLGLGALVTDSVVSYLIAAYIPGPYMPWVGFVWLMGHMSISHIIREFVTKNASTIDITGAHMVLVMKLGSFCWHVWDGKQKQSELTEEQKERAITKMPSILDYAGFVAFFPSLMIGPTLDFMDYKRWLRGTQGYSAVDGTEKMPAKRPKMPGSKRAASYKLITGLLWLGVFVQLSPVYNMDLILGPKYPTFTFPSRVFHLHMMSLVERFKYYAIWSLTEGACILSGIGFNGIDPISGAPKWDRLTNIKPLGVEFAQNSYAYLGNWNLNTNQWLRTCVYLRVTPKGKKPGFAASIATFFTSAFWHGFAPGYYIAFILASFIQNIAKDSRRLLRPFFMTPDGRHPTAYKRIYDFGTYLVTQLTYSFVTAPFLLLSISRINQAWRQVYYYPIIGIVLCNAFLLSPARKTLQKAVNARSTRPKTARKTSRNSPDEPTLGIPSEPSHEIEQMKDEIMNEVKRRGGSLSGPDGVDLRKMVDDFTLKNGKAL